MSVARAGEEETGSAISALAAHYPDRGPKINSPRYFTALPKAFN